MIRIARNLMMWALLAPLALFAASNPPVYSSGQRLIVPAAPRDDADEDSVILHWDFEDGMQDWSSTDLTDIGSKWHISEFHAFEDGQGWWCGDEELEGYDNHWLQYLQTPPLDLRGGQNAGLNFKIYWSVENPAGSGLCSASTIRWACRLRSLWWPSTSCLRADLSATNGCWASPSGTTSSWRALCRCRMGSSSAARP